MLFTSNACKMKKKYSIIDNGEYSPWEELGSPCKNTTHAAEVWLGMEDDGDMD